MKKYIIYIKNAIRTRESSKYKGVLEGQPINTETSKKIHIVIQEGTPKAKHL
jgi:hypothetical protein